MHRDRSHRCILNASDEEKLDYDRHYDQMVQTFVEISSHRTSWKVIEERSKPFREVLETASMFSKLEKQGLPPFIPDVEILERF